MNKRKVIIDTLVIIIAFVLFIVWFQKRNDNIAVTLPLSNYEIYLITMDQEDRFWYFMNQGAADMASMLGVNYIWDAPITRDVEEQIRVFDNAVNSGANAILLAASDPVRISGAVENAKAAGVRIIYVDAPANIEAETTFATENYNAGRIAGNAMISELVENGIQSGSIGIIGVTAENITTLNREKGFRDVISEDGRYELLHTLYAGGIPDIAKEAANIYMNDRLDLVGIFGTNEGSTIGLGNAIMERRSNIIGIGFDITNEIQEMIRRDILKAVLVQNPYTMGYLGMAQAVAALQGYDTGPPFIDTGVTLITRFNLQRSPLLR